MNSLRYCFTSTIFCRVQPRWQVHSNVTRQTFRFMSSLVGCRTVSRQQTDQKCLQYSIPLVSSLSKYSTFTQVDRETFWGRVKQQMGFMGKLKYNKQKLRLSGYNMYVCCQSMVDFQELFQDLDLPDTFNSWFLITELHVWLCMVRLAQLGKEGLVVRNSLVEAMWTDVDKRSKHLGDAASLTARREGVKELAHVFYASLFAYDEGIMGDDRVLAGTVWRVLFEMADKEPEQLSLMVEYIRKQAFHLDYQNPDLILKNGIITFLPLYGDKLNREDIDDRLFKIFNKKFSS